MNEAGESLMLRWARWQTRALARMWPEESRLWGEAIAAEAEEIEQPLAAVGWALGGATVYLRALGTHLLEWLKTPVGQRDGAAPLAGAPGPKRSRLFAAVVLAGAAGLLCLPEGREAIRTVKASWENYAEVDPSQVELAKLAVQAEKENDAQAMAFAALGLDDTKRATELADRAVKLDPRLFWVYEARRFWGDETRAAAQEWATKAEAADPNNAAPYLIAASSIAERIYFGLAKQHTPTDAEVLQALSSNAEWVASMDKAFQAPQYDSHYREHEELNREIWRREPQLSSATVLPGLFAHAIPSLLSLDRFTKLLIQRAEGELAAGHVDKAQVLLGEADTFSKRMQTDSARSGWFIKPGLSLEHESALGWKVFYERTGQTAKAQEAAQRAAQIEQRGAEGVREAQRRWERQNQHEGGASAWVVQIGALVVVLAGVAAALAIGSFEFWPAMKKNSTMAIRVLAWTADSAPVAVLVASAAFLLGFLPYARATQAFREGGAATNDEMRQLRIAYGSLQNVTWNIAGPDGAVLGWTLLTVALSLVAALILARMVYRATRTAAPQA